MKKKALLLLSFLFFWGISYSQNKEKSIRELLSQLQREKEDTVKVNLYNLISKHYLKTNIDSVQYYAQKGIILSRKLKYEKGEIKSLNALGNYFENKTEFQKALSTYNKALQIAKKNNDTEGFAILYNNIGMVYIKQGKYEEALTLMVEALKAEEIRKNDYGIAQAYNNIGVIYYYQQNFNKATDYFEKSLALEEKLDNTESVIQAINNLGAIYDYLNENEKAIAQYQKAFKINSKANNKREMATNLHNIAVSYYKMKKYDLSKDFHNRSLKLRKESGDKNAIALAYFNYGEVLRSGKEYQKAKEYYDNALEIAKDNGLKIIKQHVFGALAELYEAQNNFQKANDYLYKFIDIKDSILNTENSQIIAETETKYQTEKKEKEILIQKAEIAENRLKLERKNQLIIGVIALAALGCLIAFQFYRTQRLKNKQLQKENELKDALIKIETQSKIQEERLRISRDLHDNIGSQLTFIISSLDNLKFQLKKENPEAGKRLEDINQFTRTTISELRDTIWAMNKESISFSDLRLRTNNFIESAKMASPGIDFQISQDNGIDESHKFTAFEGINMYRVIQEFINNSIKHSGATEIKINFTKDGDHFLIGVCDNGKGFDPDTATQGNGLNNMHKRIAEIGGGLNIKSRPGKGTELKLNI